MVRFDSFFMNRQLKTNEKPIYQIFSSDADKRCTCCGQGIVPFKLGVCVCGHQMGSTQYVQNPVNFAKRYYSFIGFTASERYDTAVDETYAGIEEFDLFT